MVDGAGTEAAGVAPGFTIVPDDDALRNLQKIDHIVVLMLENRSFDHMLGFLANDEGRTDVDGPTKALSNEAGGKPYPVHPATSTKLVKKQDPPHGPDSADAQINGGKMDGFAADFARERKGQDPAVAMAYHTAEQLPVYGFLAEEFCVCDRWFCSLPGETMPNRCYAVAGTSNGQRKNKRGKLPTDQLWGLESFVRHLKPDDWRWYSHDIVSMLWMIDFDGAAAHPVPAYFDKWDFGTHRSFVARAKHGKLAPVSWIDPNFDSFPGPGRSNDDHPPSDLLAGQKLVLSLFNTVVRSKRSWENAMVVITYDEHGGFFDHVPPPSGVQDDYPETARYGPRVPAIVISPRVGQGAVDHTVFDHTSIIKTILARFCRDEKTGRIPWMGKRVDAAQHLGVLLTEKKARDPIPQAAYQHLLDEAASWELALAQESILAAGGPVEPPTDFQEDYAAMREAVFAKQREAGVAFLPPRRTGSAGGSGTTRGRSRSGR